MSRIGMRPVAIPPGVKVTVEPTVFHVEGPKGKLSQEYRPEVQIAVKDGFAIVQRKDDSKQTRAYHGLYRSLLNNMVTGVSQGFRRALVISGVGYRAEVQGNLLALSIGYSTDVVAMIPEGLKVTVDQKWPAKSSSKAAIAPKLENLRARFAHYGSQSRIRARVFAMKKSESEEKLARLV